MKKLLLLLFIVLTVFLLPSCLSMPSSSEDTFSVEAGVLQNISRVTDDGISKTSAVVSPDGKMLLYTEFTSKLSMTDVLGSTTQESQIILLKNINSPAKTKLPLTWAYTPAWYPDNKTVVCAGFEDKQTKLIRSSIEGGGKTYITRSAVGNSDLAPKVKGKQLICCTRISGKNQVVLMNLDGSEVTILCEGESPSWHPTEDKVVFIRNGGIYELNMPTGQTTEIYRDEKLPCALPSYSASGKQILFTQVTPVNLKGTSRLKTIAFGSHVNQIYLMNADGSGRTQLTSGSQNVFGAVWGADRTVFFIANVNGKTDIWKAKVITPE